MALTMSPDWCSNARTNIHTSTSCAVLTPANVFKPTKLSFNHKVVGSGNYRSFSWNSKKSCIGFKAIITHAYKYSTPNQEEENSNEDEEKWAYQKYQALLKGGEEVTSVLEEMIELLKDIGMDPKSEETAVQIAAQGVMGKRLESLDNSFMMALDYMLGQSENEVGERKWLLEVIKDTVLSYMTRKLPPHVQVVAMLCQTPKKESRLELLRRVAGGGGTFDYETGGKVVLPKANLNDIGNQADDLLQSMEEKQTVPDRRLLSRLVLVREEARSMMGGGILDERNDRGLSTLPQAEVEFISRLVALRPGPAVRQRIKNVMEGRDEGYDKNITSDDKIRGTYLNEDAKKDKKNHPIRPGMFLETVTKVLGGLYESRATTGISVQLLEWVHRETLNILQEIAFGRT